EAPGTLARRTPLADSSGDGRRDRSRPPSTASSRPVASFTAATSCGRYAFQSTKLGAASATRTRITRSAPAPIVSFFTPGASLLPDEGASCVAPALGYH